MAESEFAEQLLQVYDVSDAVAVAEAEREVVW
jgi:hypothetical protein